MKNILFTFLALSLLIIGGAYLGRSLATASARFQPIDKYTIVQETRDSDGKLVATELRAYDGGQYYYQHTNAENGHQFISLMNKTGRYRNVDESDPARMVRTGDSHLLFLPDEFQTAEHWQNQPGFQRFDTYQGRSVAVRIDEMGEQWSAPQFWPTPWLRSVGNNGRITEAVRISIGEADAAYFAEPVRK